MPIYIPPNGLAGFAQQTAAVQRMGMRGGSRSTGTRRRRKKKAAPAAPRRRAKRAKSGGRMKKGSAAAKAWGRKMKRLRRR